MMLEPPFGKDSELTYLYCLKLRALKRANACWSTQ